MSCSHLHIKVQPKNMYMKNDNVIIEDFKGAVIYCASCEIELPDALVEAYHPDNVSVLIPTDLVG